IDEPHRREVELADVDVDVEHVLVVRRAPVLAVRLDHRQRDTGCLEILVALAEVAPERAARALEVAQVVRVVADAHLVGVAEDDADFVTHYREASAAIRITRAGWRTTARPSISASAARRSPSRASWVRTMTQVGSPVSCTTCATDTPWLPRLV